MVKPSFHQHATADAPHPRPNYISVGVSLGRSSATHGLAKGTGWVTHQVSCSTSPQPLQRPTWFRPRLDRDSCQFRSTANKAPTCSVSPDSQESPDVLCVTRRPRLRQELRLASPFTVTRQPNLTRHHCRVRVNARVRCRCRASHLTMVPSDGGLACRWQPVWSPSPHATPPSPGPSWDKTPSIDIPPSPFPRPHPSHPPHQLTKPSHLRCFPVDSITPRV